MSPLPYKKNKNSIWARSSFHLKKVAKSYKMMDKFEILKNNHLCTAHLYKIVLEQVVQTLRFCSGIESLMG